MYDEQFMILKIWKSNYPDLAMNFGLCVCFARLHEGIWQRSFPKNVELELPSKRNDLNS